MAQHRTRSIAVALVACGVLVAACGDDDGGVVLACDGGPIASLSGIGDPGAGHIEPGEVLADVEAETAFGAASWEPASLTEDEAVYVVRDGGDIVAIAEIVEAAGTWSATGVVACGTLDDLTGG